MKKILSFILIMCMFCLAMPFSLANSYRDSRIMGDVNFDGILNTGDATLVLKFCSSIVIFDDEQQKFGDANLDGFVNTADATYILRVAAGMAQPNYYSAEYTISFTGGSLADAIVPTEVKAEAGSEYTITGIAICDGHTFRGWLCDFDNRLYNAGGKFIMPSQNVTLRAMWDNEQIPDTSEQPTGQPTIQPTQNPQGNLELKLYDKFNEVQVNSAYMNLPDGQTVINANNITLPDGYKLWNKQFTANVNVVSGTAVPSYIQVDVYPYQILDNYQEFKAINTVEGFKKVRDDVMGNYILNTDIDLKGENFVPIGWKGTSITADILDYVGIFDGNGYSIYNLYMDYDTQQTESSVDEPVAEKGSHNFYVDIGLFGINEGTIRNLNVYTTYYDGVNMNFGVFGDCNVGGIAGYNGGKIINCHVVGNVGSLYCGDGLIYGGGGGICGNNNGYIQKCSFEGGVEGFSYIGGICGKNFGAVEECYFAGGINSGLEAEYVWQYSICMIGGLTGAMDGMYSNNASHVSNSYAFFTNAVNGDQFVGGMIGWVRGGYLENCYVVHDENLHWVTDYGAADIGAYVNGYMPSMSGLYAYDGTESQSDGLPEEYSPNVWDMNGAGYNMLPDLIKNRRPAKWADED